MSEHLMLPEHLTVIQKSMQGAAIHASHNPDIEVLPYYPFRYYGQFVDEYHTVSPNERLEPSVIEWMGGQRVAQFGSILDQFKAAEQEHGILSDIKERLAVGQTIAFLMDHGGLFDPATIQAAADVMLRTMGADFTNGLVMGKPLVPYASFNGEPLADTMLYLCQDLFWSFPDTETCRALGFPPELTDAHNSKMAMALARWMMKGKKVIAVPANGTTRKGQDLAIVNDATAGLLIRKQVDVVPTAVEITDARATIILDNPRHLKTTDDVHNIMHWGATALNLACGTHYEYLEKDEPDEHEQAEADPIVRKD